MSVIKVVGLQSGSHDISLEIPNKKVIFVKSKLCEHFMYVVESLLARDASGYYWELDMQSGAKYQPIEGTSYVMFNDGGITCQDKVVQVSGVIPNIHVIRYPGVDYQFRSFYLQNNLSTYSPVYSDMRKYSAVIDDAKWVRLIMTVNELLGFEFVSLQNGDLTFDSRDGFEITEECQKFIYMLMAECYLTPEGYKRVLLLSDILLLDKFVQMKLLQRLSEIPGFSVAFSTAPVDWRDFKAPGMMSLINF